MTYLYVLAAVDSKSLNTLVIFACQYSSIRSAKALKFTYGFFLGCTFLVIVEIRPTSKVRIALVAGDSNAFEHVRGLAMQLLHF